MNGRNHFRDGSRGVTFETEDVEVTAACASGYAGSSHLEMYEYRMKLLLPDEDYSLVEITAEVEEILPEDELLVTAQLQGQERSARIAPHGGGFKAICRTKVSETSGDETEEDDDGDETRFGVSSRPRVRSSRKRLKRQPPDQKNMKADEAKEERLMLEKVPNRAEVAEEKTTEPSISILVGILIIIFLVVGILIIIYLWSSCIELTDTNTFGSETLSLEENKALSC
nr:uncharacterized protein LOC110360797 isoform X2 [Columba livia]